MGVDYRATIVVGLPIDDLELQRNDCGEWDEDGILEFVPSYYDADCGVVGVVVYSTPDYDYRKIDLDVCLGDVKEAKETFFKITGQEGSLYLSTHGW